MRRIPAQAKYHAILVNGVVAGLSEGDAFYRPDREIVWFDSIKDRETYPAVQDWRRRCVNVKLKAKVEDEKSDAEYNAKNEESGRWLRNNPTGDVGDFTPDSYPFMALEVAAKSITPRECVESIREAIKRNGAEMGPLERAKLRINLRESLRVAEAESQSAKTNTLLKDS